MKYPAVLRSVWLEASAVDAAAEASVRSALVQPPGQVLDAVLEAPLFRHVVLLFRPPKQQHAQLPQQEAQGGGINGRKVPIAIPGVEIEHELPETCVQSDDEEAETRNGNPGADCFEGM